MLKNGDLAGEAAARLGEFKADETTTDHNQMFWDDVEFENFDVGEKRRLMKSGDVRDGRARADIEEDAIADDRSRSTHDEPNGECRRSGKSCMAHADLCAGGLVFCEMQGDEAFDHVTLALAHAVQGDGDRAGDGSELFTMSSEMSNASAPDFVLGEQAVDVGA